MKRKILPLFVMFWVLGHIQFMAQPPKGQFSPQDFVKHLESFIVREACLTPAEATAFFPIFHELHDKQRGINWQIRELKKRSLPAHSTDKDYYNLIKEINKLKIESAELEDVYYKKMCKAVPARRPLPPSYATQVQQPAGQVQAKVSTARHAVLFCFKFISKEYIKKPPPSPDNRFIFVTLKKIMI